MLGRQPTHFRFGVVKQTQKSEEFRCGRQPFVTHLRHGLNAMLSSRVPCM
jgi:hypothetical protein